MQIPHYHLEYATSVSLQITFPSSNVRLDPLLSHDTDRTENETISGDTQDSEAIS
jgi:hypothetical protein